MLLAAVLTHSVSVGDNRKGKEEGNSGEEKTTEKGLGEGGERDWRGDAGCRAVCAKEAWQVEAGVCS